jgi:hypothetical protein
MIVTVAVIKKLMAVKGSQVAVVFSRSVSEGLQGSGKIAESVAKSHG